MRWLFFLRSPPSRPAGALPASRSQQVGPPTSVQAQSPRSPRPLCSGSMLCMPPPASRQGKRARESRPARSGRARWGEAAGKKAAQRPLQNVPPVPSGACPRRLRPPPARMTDSRRPRKQAEGAPPARPRPGQQQKGSSRRPQHPTRCCTGAKAGRQGRPRPKHAATRLGGGAAAGKTQQRPTQTHPAGGRLKAGASSSSTATATNHRRENASR